MPEIFQDNDSGYIAWKNANPMGFVIVSHNPPSGSYTTLHRADCGSLNPYNVAAKSWTVKYAKICSDNKSDLEHWCIETLGRPVVPCGHCAMAGRV